MTAQNICDRFAELGAQIALKDVENRINTLTVTFKVPVSDAESSVVSYFLRENDIERSEYYVGQGSTQTLTVSELPQQDGQWVSMRVKLTDIWESTSEHIVQLGLVGDETGKTKFVLWRNAGLEPMELNKSYTLDNVVTSLYNGRISITLNKTSVITEISNDIEVGYVTAEYTGVLVKIKSGSGLIKRCPECNRALDRGMCATHDNVDGVNDIRILGVLDDGHTTQDVIIDRATTESIWGHTLDEAVAMAVESFDASVVLEDMEHTMLGKYFKATGGMADTTIIVSDCEAI